MFLGLIHVGDKVQEINGILVRNKDPKEMVMILVSIYPNEKKCFENFQNESEIDVYWLNVK